MTTEDQQLIGEVGGDLAGYSLANAGDVNDDGIGDMIIGAYGNDLAAADAGMAYVVYGPVSGDTDLSFANCRLIGAMAPMRQVRASRVLETLMVMAMVMSSSARPTRPRVAPMSVRSLWSLA